MKKCIIMATCTLCGMIALVIAGYLVARAGDPGVPGGMYSSFEFWGHAKADVVEFENGEVMWRTCCGDEWFGTYHREAGGRWIWIYQQEMRPADRTQWRLSDPIRYVVRPERFAIIVAPEDGSSPPLRMPRRVFEKYPF